MRGWISAALLLGLLAASCSGPTEATEETAPSAPPSTPMSTAEVPALAPTTIPMTVSTTAPQTVPASMAEPGPSPGSSEGSTTTTIAALDSLAYREVTIVPFPVDLVPFPASDLLVIVSKDGRLWLYGDGVVHSDPLLDIRDRVRDRGEQGLLGVVFSLDYAASGRLFVHYTARNGDTVLAEYVAVNGEVDPDGETVLWRISQPAANHNGGTITFGPDGYLYMGLGDGGGANDQFGNGQNDRTALGALLRFDVSVPGVLSPAPGNPFPAPEVWAIGLRNPWRFVIDRPSGLIVIADVGQNSFEEVSVAPIDEPGLNYGWPITEGLHCFRPRSGCDAGGLTLPLLEVEHGDGGTCSITGGVVYRGAEIPELYGHYLFSDYCGGYLRSFLLESPADPPTDWTDQVGNAGQVVALGTDSAGEVYVMTAAGSVLRLVAERG